MIPKLFRVETAPLLLLLWMTRRLTTCALYPRYSVSSSPIMVLPAGFSDCFPPPNKYLCSPSAANSVRDSWQSRDLDAHLRVLESGISRLGPHSLGKNASEY